MFLPWQPIKKTKRINIKSTGKNNDVTINFLVSNKISSPNDVID